MHFYCLHALTGGNQRIQIREKKLEFSTADIVYSTLLPLQEIKPTACARMKLTRIMLAALIQFTNAFQPTHCDIFHWLLISRSQFLRFKAFCWPYP